MVRTILIFFILVILILWFIYGIVIPLFRKKVSTTPEELDFLEQEVDKTVEAQEEVKAKVSKADEKISQIKNKLKK